MCNPRDALPPLGVPRIRQVLLLGLALMTSHSSSRPVIARDAVERIVKEEITFANDPDMLAGTLYSPAEAAQCPAVVLLTGSNRGPRGPLLARIARHFAEHGILTLHYDSAGTGRSTGNSALQSRNDRAREAIAAVRFLRDRSNTDPGRIGIWGGSEGASIALLAATIQGSEVSFVIPVSGGVQVGGSMLEQTYHAAEKFAHANGLSLGDTQKIVTFEQLSSVIVSGLDILDWNLIEVRAKQWTTEPWPELIRVARMRVRSDELSADDKQQTLDSLRRVMGPFTKAKWSRLEPWQVKNIERVLELEADQVFAFLDKRGADWDWDLRRYKKKVKCPVLSIFGEDDNLAPARLIAARMTQYLAESKNANFEVKVMPGAGHYLTKTGSGSMGDFIPGYLDSMTLWIHNCANGDAETQACGFLSAEPAP